MPAALVYQLELPGHLKKRESRFSISDLWSLTDFVEPAVGPVAEGWGNHQECVYLSMHDGLRGDNPFECHTGGFTPPPPAHL